MIVRKWSTIFRRLQEIADKVEKNPKIFQTAFQRRKHINKRDEVFAILSQKIFVNF